MSDQSLAARAYASAKRMYDQDPSRMRRPEPEDFAGLDAIQTTTPTKETTAPPEPGWDTSAFDILPDALRQPVMAGTARALGRAALELAAQGELLRPTDAHLHLTNPSRYVDGDGRIDRAAIRTDLDRLTRERPELSRFGVGPGQVGVRPDERRRAAPGASTGAGGVPTTDDAVAVSRARMEAASGVKFARS
jgi:hypothetical protein